MTTSNQRTLSALIIAIVMASPMLVRFLCR